MASNKAPFQKQDTWSSPTTTKSPNSIFNDTKPAFHEEEFNKMQESLGQLTIKQQMLTTIHQFCSNSPPPSQPKSKKQLSQTISATTRSYAKSAEKNQRRIISQKIHPSIIKMICGAAA
jgi:hypothetical protein